MEEIIKSVNEAYYKAYRECHNREQWEERQYNRVEIAENLASQEIKDIRDKLTKSQEMNREMLEVIRFFNENYDLYCNNEKVKHFLTKYKLEIEGLSDGE